jgi:hypothetical protein
VGTAIALELEDQGPTIGARLIAVDYEGPPLHRGPISIEQRSPHRHLKTGLLRDGSPPILLDLGPASQGRLERIALIGGVIGEKGADPMGIASLPGLAELFDPDTQSFAIHLASSFAPYMVQAQKTRKICFY